MRTIASFLIILLSTSVFSQATINNIQNRVRLQNNIGLSGRVFCATSPNQYAKSVVLSDMKVVLIKAGSISVEDKFILDNRVNICNNDPNILNRFDIKITYTDLYGRYQFRDLSPNSNYFLMYCDKKIQMTIVSTNNNRNITYSLKDKIVYL